MDILGRNRKPQMALAEKWGIKDYPSPAGGCKLTEPNYSIRLKEVLDRKEDVTEKDIHLLKYGRHFISENNTKVIVSRTGEEGKRKQLLNNKDMMFITSKFNGAMVIIPEGDNPTDDDLAFACRLAVRYSKGKDEELVQVKFGQFSTEFNIIKDVTAMTQEELDKHNIN